MPANCLDSSRPSTSNNNPEHQVQFRTTVQDLMKEEVLRQVIDLLAKPVPVEKFLLLAQITPPYDDPTKAVAWPLGVGFSETLIGKYLRHLVPPTDIMPGCYMRGVVKVIVFFSDGSSSTGSGFLTDYLIVATAGHVVDDDIHGHAQYVVVQAGLGGADNAIESRRGVCVVVNSNWYNGRSGRNDLAFIRLGSPFNTVEPLQYMQTPVTDNGITASVYGFPGDIPESAPGQRLCATMCPVRYSLSCSAGMLEYEGDTEKGTSGGPVLNADRIVIALHRGWDYDADGRRINQAVTINRYGNDFGAFRQVLEYMAGNERGSVSRLREEGRVRGFTFTW
ncbi:trypsin-like cysteine/serine peptidase domain-containing protein [Hypoxylon argillaceum]|nr:trypsin-like cysteine/serine peptidase domain-containing protein [Hypoxylon argillaceum]